MKTLCCAVCRSTPWVADGQSGHALEVEVRDGVGFGFLACGVGIAAVEDFQHLNGIFTYLVDCVGRRGKGHADAQYADAQCADEGCLFSVVSSRDSCPL